MQWLHVKTNECYNDATKAMSNVSSKMLISKESTSFETMSSGYSCFQTLNSMCETIQHLKETCSKENIMQVKTFGKLFSKRMEENNSNDLIIDKIINFNATNEDNNIEKIDVMIISSMNPCEHM